MPKRRTTTKDVALLRQLHTDEQLKLAPEFQRNSVWPRAAKSYLIDTILHDLPIPPLLFRRGESAQNGRPTYEVIDGQQRLRALFLFLDDRLRLSERAKPGKAGPRFSDLPTEDRERILDYDFVVEELSGYSQSQITDIFTRTNKYTVSLSSQELRNAKATGQFSTAVKEIGDWGFWSENKVFTPGQFQRMRNIEFAAELLILLAEGPQDKKSSIDIWYANYRETFAPGASLRKRLLALNGWVSKALPDLESTRFRKPVDLYSLIGAVDLVSIQGDKLSSINPKRGGVALRKFESQIKAVETEMKNPLGKRSSLDRNASRYFLAASRQTDNITPRQTRIDILATLLG